MDLAAPEVSCLGTFPIRFVGGMWDREVTIYEGVGGLAESSPLPGYFEDADACSAAAISTASAVWPARRRNRVAVNGLIPLGPLAPLIARALIERDAGTRCFKIKVEDHRDVERVAAIRAALGPEIALRVDANACWSLEEARAFIAAVQPFEIEYIEDPVGTLEDAATLREDSTIRIALDMLVRSADDARRVQQIGAADVLVVKVQPLGGLHNAFAIAESFEGDVVVSSMMESSVGIQVGLALACALKRAPLACGLATATLLQSDVVTSPLVPSEGSLSWPAARMELITNSSSKIANANGCST